MPCDLARNMEGALGTCVAAMGTSAAPGLEAEEVAGQHVGIAVRTSPFSPLL